MLWVVVYNQLDLSGQYPTRPYTCKAAQSQVKDLPQLIYMPIDTDDRKNGWFAMAFSLDIKKMNCDIQEFIAAVIAEGAPCWVVFWPQCHTEQVYKQHNAFGESGFPFKSKEYTNPSSIDYSNVNVPNAVWHQSHTFTCFAFPTFTEENCQQIGSAIAKVIKAYSK